MTNYLDKQGNYINCENLSLAEIYHRAFALGVESVAIDKRPQGDLISREALKKALKSNCTPEMCHDYGTNWCEVCCHYNDFEDLIDNAPTVEERLIRCKDCKHTVLSEDGKTLICCLTMRVGTVRPNFYCGNGEMKGGAE